jgi:ubiquitin-protein ligase
MIINAHFSVEERYQDAKGRLERYKHLLRFGPELYPPAGSIVLAPFGRDLQLWHVTMTGLPSSSPYHGVVIRLEFVVLNHYPFYPPRVRMLTEVVHPNVHPQSRQWNFPMLTGNWTPALFLEDVAFEVYRLLLQPYSCLNDALDQPLRRLLESGRADLFEAAVRDSVRRAVAASSITASTATEA